MGVSGSTSNGSIPGVFYARPGERSVLLQNPEAYAESILNSDLSVGSSEVSITGVAAVDFLQFPERLTNLKSRIEVVNEVLIPRLSVDTSDLSEIQIQNMRKFNAFRVSCHLYRSYVENWLSPDNPANINDIEHNETEQVFNPLYGGEMGHHEFAEIEGCNNPSMGVHDRNIVLLYPEGKMYMIDISGEQRPSRIYETKPNSELIATFSELMAISPSSCYVYRSDSVALVLLDKKIELPKLPKASDGKFVYSIFNKTLHKYDVHGSDVTLINTTPLSCVESNLLKPYTGKIALADPIMLITNGRVIQQIVLEGSDAGTYTYFSRCFRIVDGTHLCDFRFTLHYLIHSGCYDPVENVLWITGKSQTGRVLVKYPSCSSIPEWVFDEHSLSEYSNFYSLDSQTAQAFAKHTFTEIQKACILVNLSKHENFKYFVHACDKEDRYLFSAALRSAFRWADISSSIELAREVFTSFSVPPLRYIICMSVLFENKSFSSAILPCLTDKILEGFDLHIAASILVACDSIVKYDISPVLAPILMCKKSALKGEADDILAVYKTSPHPLNKRQIMSKGKEDDWNIYSVIAAFLDVSDEESVKQCAQIMYRIRGDMTRAKQQGKGAEYRNEIEGKLKYLNTDQKSSKSFTKDQKAEALMAFFSSSVSLEDFLIYTGSIDKEITFVTKTLSMLISLTPHEHIAGVTSSIAHVLLSILGVSDFIQDPSDILNEIENLSTKVMYAPHPIRSSIVSISSQICARLGYELPTLIDMYRDSTFSASTVMLAAVLGHLREQGLFLTLNSKRFEIANLNDMTVCHLLTNVPVIDSIIEFKPSVSPRQYSQVCIEVSRTYTDELEYFTNIIGQTLMGSHLKNMSLEDQLSLPSELIHFLRYLLLKHSTLMSKFVLETIIQKEPAAIAGVLSIFSEALYVDSCNNLSCEGYLINDTTAMALPITSNSPNINYPGFKASPTEPIIKFSPDMVSGISIILNEVVEHLENPASDPHEAVLSVLSHAAGKVFIEHSSEYVNHICSTFRNIPARDAIFSDTSNDMSLLLRSLLFQSKNASPCQATLSDGTQCYLSAPIDGQITMLAKLCNNSSVGVVSLGQPMSILYDSESRRVYHNGLAVTDNLSVGSYLEIYVSSRKLKVTFQGKMKPIFKMKSTNGPLCFFGRNLKTEPILRYFKLKKIFGTPAVMTPYYSVKASWEVSLDKPIKKYPSPTELIETRKYFQSFKGATPRGLLREPGTGGFEILSKACIPQFLIEHAKLYSKSFLDSLVLKGLQTYPLAFFNLDPPPAYLTIRVLLIHELLPFHYESRSALKGAAPQALLRSAISKSNRYSFMSEWFSIVISMITDQNYQTTEGGMEFMVALKYFLHIANDSERLMTEKLFQKVSEAILAGSPILLKYSGDIICHFTSIIPPPSYIVGYLFVASKTYDNDSLQIAVNDIISDAMGIKDHRSLSRCLMSNPPRQLFESVSRQMSNILDYKRLDNDVFFTAHIDSICIITGKKATYSIRTHSLKPYVLKIKTGRFVALSEAASGITFINEAPETFIVKTQSVTEYNPSIYSNNQFDEQILSALGVFVEHESDLLKLVKSGIPLRHSVLSFRALLLYNYEKTVLTGQTPPCKAAVTFKTASSSLHTRVKPPKSKLTVTVNRRLAASARGGTSPPSESLIGQFARCYTPAGSIKVYFTGEAGKDSGGLAREFATLIAEEVADSSLGYFVPTPNSHYGEGKCRDCVIPSQSRHSDAYRAIGGLLSIGIMTGFPQGIEFPPSLWNYIAGDTLTDEAIKEIDIRGEVKMEDLVSLYEPIKTGFWECMGILPPVFITGKYLERMACGEKDIDTEKLKSVTEFLGVKIAQVNLFWEVVDSLSPSHRVGLLKFATGSARIPSSHTGPFLYVDRVAGVPDKLLPSSSTCAYRLHLPEFSSAEKMKKAITVAIEYTGTFEKW